MLNTNESPVAFSGIVDGASKAIHEHAVLCAEKYLEAEASLLSAVMKVDADQTYLKLGETYLTPYCVKFLKLDSNAAAMFVTIARRSVIVPELKMAVDEGLSVTKARVISSVVTPEN